MIKMLVLEITCEFEAIAAALLSTLEFMVLLIDDEIDWSTAVEAVETLAPIFPAAKFSACPPSSGSARRTCRRTIAC